MRFVAILFVILICCDARYVPENGVYSVPEKMPQYKMGMDAFQQHIDSSIQHLDQIQPGDVFVSFIISKNGKLKDLKITKSHSPKNDSIAMSIIRNAPENWVPGEYDGKPVEVKMTYPIKFN